MSENFISCFWFFVLPLCTGILLDRLFADPDFSWHPIRVMGKGVAFLSKKLNQGSDGARFYKGTFTAFFLITLTFLFFYCTEKLLQNFFSVYFSGWFIFLWRTVFVFFFIAAEGLLREGKNVLEKSENNILFGRQALARIVGRQTSHLDKQAVYRALLETLSENLSDGVSAPVFFYVLGGIPAMAVYKMINTLDSMIAYKNTEFLYFGKTAAHLDDTANFIPARFTALLMLAVTCKLNKTKQTWHFARKHESPNAGYPEAALTQILQVRLGGPCVYFGKEKKKAWLGNNRRVLTKKDVIKTFLINRHVLLLLLLLITLAIALLPTMATICSALFG